MSEGVQPIKNKNWKNIIFFAIFGLLILGSVAFTYYKIMIKRDYLISAEANCDPTVEKCFIYVCDPSVEECTGKPEEDTSYYKIIKRKAFNIPLCDPNDENCEALVCPEREKDCSMELCEEGNKEGVECNNPEQYNIDHPATDETDVSCNTDEEDCSGASDGSSDNGADSGGE
jgi:hypothetical protein